MRHIGDRFRAVARDRSRLGLVVLAAGIGATVAISAANPSAMELRVATAPGAVNTFVPDRLIVAGASRVLLRFENRSSEPHNFTLLEPLTARTSTIVEPGATESIEFETPATGTYPFVCTIHDRMTGVLLVE